MLLGGKTQVVHGMWVARGMLVAQKEARGRKFVLVVGGKDISPEIRAAQHVTRPAGSVGKKAIFKSDVHKVTRVMKEGSRAQRV